MERPNYWPVCCGQYMSISEPDLIDGQAVFVCRKNYYHPLVTPAVPLDRMLSDLQGWLP